MSRMSVARWAKSPGRWGRFIASQNDGRSSTHGSPAPESWCDWPGRIGFPQATQRSGSAGTLPRWHRPGRRVNRASEAMLMHYPAGHSSAFPDSSGAQCRAWLACSAYLRAYSSYTVRRWPTRCTPGSIIGPRPEPAPRRKGGRLTTGRLPTGAAAPRSRSSPWPGGSAVEPRSRWTIDRPRG